MSDEFDINLDEAFDKNKIDVNLNLNDTPEQDDID